MGDQAGSEREIETALNAGLARKGVAGKVVVRAGGIAELHDRAQVVALELGDWVRQWPLLPPEIQQRKVDAALPRLLDAARSNVAPSTATAASRAARRQRTGILKAVLALALVTAAIWWLRSANFFGPLEQLVSPAGSASAAGSAAVEETEAQRAARTERTCEAARGRLKAGGTMAGLDVEGWEAVLWLARPTSDRAWMAAVERRVREGSLGSEARLALQAGERGSIELERPGEAPELAIARPSMALHFGGDFALAFFDAAGRQRFVSFAAKVAAEEGVELAALYAQCAHRHSHDVGAWYWGKAEAGAATALLFAAGLLGEPRLAQLEPLAVHDDGLVRLQSAAATRRPLPLAEIVTAHGGSLGRPPPGSKPGDAGDEAARGVSIAFPLGGPTRAAAAARDLALRFGLDGDASPARAPQADVKP